MLNRVILVGTLTKAPESKTVGQSMVVTLQVATNSSYKDKAGEWQQKTDRHRVSIWGKRAEYVANHTQAGSVVVVEGKSQTRSYDKDGEKVFITEINADAVQVVPGATGEIPAPYENRTARGASAQQPYRQAQAKAPVEDESDMPF